MRSHGPRRARQSGYRRCLPRRVGRPWYRGAAPLFGSPARPAWWKRGQRRAGRQHLENRQGQRVHSGRLRPRLVGQPSHALPAISGTTPRRPHRLLPTGAGIHCPGRPVRRGHGQYGQGTRNHKFECDASHRPGSPVRRAGPTKRTSCSTHRERREKWDRRSRRGRPAFIPRGAKCGPASAQGEPWGKAAP